MKSFGEFYDKILKSHACSNPSGSCNVCDNILNIKCKEIEVRCIGSSPLRYFSTKRANWRVFDSGFFKF
jgi:hypothetical protein